MSENIEGFTELKVSRSNVMSIIIGLAIALGSFVIGGFTGYQYADKMPDDPYGRCIWIAAKSKSGANVRDCESFIQDMTVAGKIENYKKCRETNKILKPDGAKPEYVKELEIDCTDLKSDIKPKKSE